ncbi:MAG: hypothetical protein QXN33_00160 [Candidatus Bathyarchaeia archaeon]
MTSLRSAPLSLFFLCLLLMPAGAWTQADYKATVEEAADRLLALQSPADHGWDWNVTGLTAHSANPSAVNLYGITADGLLKAYIIVGKRDYLRAAIRAGDRLISQVRNLWQDGEAGPGPPTLFAQDISFLAHLFAITGDRRYYDYAKARVDWLVSNKAIADFRSRYGGQPFGIWMYSAWIQALLDFGKTDMANQLADEIEATLTNSTAFYVLDRAAALMALKRVGNETFVSIQAQLLLKNQTDAGYWQDSDSRVQATAYATLALFKAGYDSAVKKGADWLVTYQLSNGGWLDFGGEYSEVDSEAIMALCAAFGKAQSQISLSIYPSTVDIARGQAFNLTAQLSPVLVGQTIVVEYSADGATWRPLAMGQTDAQGRFSTLWYPIQVGNYYFRARWDGNESYHGATSAPLLAQAIPEFPFLTLALATAFSAALLMLRKKKR